MKTIKHKLHKWLYEEYSHYLNPIITAFLFFILFLSFILVETAPKPQEKKEVDHIRTENREQVIIDIRSKKIIDLSTN
jgi:hypothetical protein